MFEPSRARFSEDCKVGIWPAKDSNSANALSRRALSALCESSVGFFGWACTVTLISRKKAPAIRTQALGRIMNYLIQLNALRIRLLHTPEPRGCTRLTASSSVAVRAGIETKGAVATSGIPIKAAAIFFIIAIA